MKILLIGANGTIGKHVAQELEQRHQLIKVGKTSGDIQCDIANVDDIKKMFDKAGKVDAIVCIAGEARWKPLDEMTEEDMYVGIRSKMMGQVNLVRIGRDYLNEAGSFTLTTGILAEDPVYQTTSAAMVNGAIHSFVLAASLEMTKKQRINVVASGLVEASVEKYKDYFPGHHPIPMDKCVRGYVRCIEGRGNGEIVRIYD